MNIENKEQVDHPLHYGGKDDPYEAIKVIEAWLGIEGLKGFCLGNALKYTSRAGKKEGNSEDQDRAKAIWYIDYYNNRVKELSKN